MFPLGILSLLQMAFLPGFLCLKLARWQSRSPLQFLIYAFALSLILNYAVIFALVSLGLYDRTSVWALIGIELCIAVSLLRRQPPAWTAEIDLSAGLRSLFKNLAPLNTRVCLAFGLALAAFCSYGRLAFRHFGTVFTLWDDVVSWNRWSQDSWAAGTFPADSGLYPQLLPANWSLSYVLLGNTDVQMFAKALMPLFSIAALLLFVDLAFRRKAWPYLVSAAIYGAVLYTFLGESLIVSGYMETALPFFGLLTVYALLEVSEEGPRFSTVLLAALFGGAAGLVKQGGLYFTVLALLWTGLAVYRRRPDLAESGELRKLSFACLAGLVLVLPWYGKQYAAFAAGTDSPNVGYLAAFTAQGRSYIDVIASAISRVYTFRGDVAKPLCWFVTLTLACSIGDSTGRKVLLRVLLPVSLLWALFFSYEVRTLSLALPFAALCSGLGIGEIVWLVGRTGKRAAPDKATANPRSPAKVKHAKASPVPAPELDKPAWWFYAAGCLLVFSLALYVEPFRNWFVAPGQRPFLTDVAQMWAGPSLLSALILCAVGVLLRRTQSLVHVNWYYAAGLVLWLWLGTGMNSAAQLVDQQIELAKKAGNPVINEAIYAIQARAPLRGKVATDYWAFGRLPGLKQFYRRQFFPDNAPPEFFTGLAAQSDVCYFLSPEERFSPAARQSLPASFRTLFVKENYRFIRTCGGPSADEDRIGKGVKFRFTLPEKPANGAEPLLIVGRVGGAVDALAVRYLPGNEFTLFQDHWGHPGCESSPIPAVAHQAYQVEFWMHPQAGGTSILLDGQHLFDCVTVYNPDTASAVLGKNTIGFTTMATAFSGAIEAQP